VTHKFYLPFIQQFLFRCAKKVIWCWSAEPQRTFNYCPKKKRLLCPAIWLALWDPSPWMGH